MYILLQGHNYRYEISEFLKLFSSEFSFIECSEDFGVNREGELLVNKLDIDHGPDRVSILRARFLRMAKSCMKKNFRKT